MTFGVTMTSNESDYHKQYRKSHLELYRRASRDYYRRKFGAGATEAIEKRREYMREYMRRYRALKKAGENNS